MSKRIAPAKKFGAARGTKSTPPTITTSRRSAINKTVPFRLMDLPSELRRRILEFTCLIVRQVPNLAEDSLTIYEGKCSIRSEKGKCCGRCPESFQCPSTQCACYVFSTALFYTCRTLSIEAREVCFSNNRIAILDRPRIGMDKFWKRQPSHLLKLIRELECVLGETDLLNGFLGSPYEGYMREDWPEFLKYVEENLNVQNLTFSIDASRPYLDWVTTGSTQADIDELGLPMIFDAIITPLQKLSGLKNLFIYWPCFHDLETNAEKSVMGNGYDAYQHGKVVLKDRAPGFPRGSMLGNDDVGMMGSYDAPK